MKTIKIIDLLNKIAKGEEVPHFIIDEQEYYLGADGFLKELYGDEVEWTLDAEWLNTEAEIKEKKKEIEAINICKTEDEYFIDKINELIEAVNKLKRDK